MSSTRALCKVCLSHIAHEVMHVRGALWAVSKDKEQLLCHHPAGEHYIGQNAVQNAVHAVCKPAAKLLVFSSSTAGRDDTIITS